MSEQPPQMSSAFQTFHKQPDCKYQNERGQPALNLGYDCRTGHEVTLAEANSYIPIDEYQGGHVLPNVKATRLGEGMVVPRECVAICDVQPLRQG